MSNPPLHRLIPNPALSVAGDIGRLSSSPFTTVTGGHNDGDTMDSNLQEEPRGPYSVSDWSIGNPFIADHSSILGLRTQFIFLDLIALTRIHKMDGDNLHNDGDTMDANLQEEPSDPYSVSD